MVHTLGHLAVVLFKGLVMALSLYLALIVLYSLIDNLIVIFF
jgi:hypothetical protein